MKVYIFSRNKTPYKTESYNEIGKYVDLTSIYESVVVTNRDSSWTKTNNDKHREVFLKTMKLKEGNYISLGINKYLKDKTSLINICEYSTLTGMLSILYLNRNKIPFILRIDGGIIKQDKEFKRKIKQYFISSASYYLSPSVKSDEYLSHYGADLDSIYRYPFTSIKEKDILVQPLSYLEKQTIRSELGISINSKIIITIGQFIHRKGFDVLLEAHKYSADDTELIIIGGTPTVEYLELISKHDLKNVHFVEFQKKDKLFKYLVAADIFVLPTREDIWGLVINEAMAVGLPIITTDNCIAGLELIENGVNGYIVPVNDVDSLSKRMKDLLSNDDMREKMSITNLEKIRGWTIESLGKRQADVFKEVWSYINNKKSS